MELFYKAHTNCKEKIKEAKNNSWTELINEELSNVSETLRMHRLLRKDNSIKMGSLLRTDGKCTHFSTETLKKLAEIHLPNHRSTFEGLHWENTKPIEQEEATRINKLFSNKGIILTISTFNP